MILVFDTETTGLPLWSKPSDHELQPHLVQLAVALCEDDTRLRAGFSLIVLPDGWSIPAEVTAVHGISEQTARAYGLPEEQVINLFLQLLHCAHLVVAHNLNFDRRILRIALKRHRPELADLWEAFPGFCTMEASRDRCALPPTDKMMAAGRRHFKSPSLAEAYQAIVGKTLPSSWHDAHGDMLASRLIYMELTRAGV